MLEFQNLSTAKKVKLSFVLFFFLAIIQKSESSSDKKFSEYEVQKIFQENYAALKKEVNVSCINGNKIIKSNFIYAHMLKSENYLKNDCPDSESSDEPKLVAVFALNTIFIDEDIVLPGGQIVFVAPQWEITGNRKIDLSGMNAPPNKARKCQLLGRNGKPGLPGAPGGVFFGIGEKFINGPKLTVILNGGRGGNGENGCPGANGKDAVFNKTWCDLDLSNGQPGTNGSRGGNGGHRGFGLRRRAWILCLDRIGRKIKNFSG